MTVAQACPICGNTSISSAFQVKDFSVSQETFTLKTCNSCHFLFTANAPDKHAISRYYQSDTYISHTDGKKGLFEKIYQIVRKRTVAGKRKMIQHFTGKQNGALLDYGCGTGAFLQEMKLSDWKINGVEPDPGARTKAEESTGISILVPGGLTSLETNSCDAITMWHVLEHVHDLEWTLEQLKRVLKEDGKLFIAVPNNNAFDAKKYGAYWAAYDVPRHLYHFTPTTMDSLMKKHGLHVVAKKPMWFDSFYVSMLSEKYKHGKIGYLSAFIIGMLSNIKAFMQVDRCSSIIYIIAK
jgi:SAM-dependent methyltransferase